MQPMNPGSFTIPTRFVIACTSVFLAGVAGCSSGAGDAPDVESPSVDVSAELDRETGAIVVPEDRYRLSEVEMYRLDDAKDALIATCAESAGVPYAVSMTDADEYLYSTVFGVWTKDAAERFAFAPPSPAPDLAANGVMVDGEPVEPPSSSSPEGSVRAAWTDADREVVDDCQASPEVMALDSAQFYSGGPWSSELGDISAGLLRSAEAEVPLAEADQVLAEYEAQQ
ncbi:hypothetical protein [Paraoerskovia marina]|uniref:hypothetical protein n=1 Tax=Paraoerskovia marina TaxID=545619 RepID=UPI00138E18C9|nr:hypothetical protein [Paraoerskovia marina]